MKVANPPDVHVLAPCCHVQSSVGVNEHTKTVVEDIPDDDDDQLESKHLLTSISIVFIEIRRHVYLLTTDH